MTVPGHSIYRLSLKKGTHMKALELSFDVRWADIDANKHMRHSAYYDYAAHQRVQLLKDIGMDVVTLSGLKIGPVLFREEAVFMREIGMDDTIRINVKIKRLRKDASRWTFIHEFRRSDDRIAAIVTVDGAWLDLNKRKLTALPDHFIQIFLGITRTDDFEFEIKE
jgi:acyl-CoA thioester hydrolase